jgi:hypothetical protein
LLKTIINKKGFSYLIGIEEFFPSENKYVYFIPYYKEGNKVSSNQGKLYNKYCNLKKEIKKIHFQSNKKHNKDNEVLINEKGIY